MNGANVVGRRHLRLPGSESSCIDEQCGSELGWLLCWQNCPEERIRLAGFVGKRKTPSTRQGSWVNTKLLQMGFFGLSASAKKEYPRR